jgi:ABC-type antimicrobial peptide transport system permease subunit
MLRVFGGVILGYIAMAILIAIVFTGVFLALGVERALQADSYEISTLWIAISLGISFGSAILGGYVCAAVSKSLRACQLLAVVVVILGVLLCLPAIQRREGPNVRGGEVSSLEAMKLGVAPTWMHLLNPVLGAVGVLLGARIKKPL